MFRQRAGKLAGIAQGGVRSTSKTGTISRSTMRRSVVRPSAASHMAVAVSLRLKSVELTGFMMMTSPSSNTRAARFGRVWDSIRSRDEAPYSRIRLER